MFWPNSSRNLANDNKPFNGIATLLSDLESLVLPSDASTQDPTHNNILAISVWLRMLALLANDSSFEASLHWNANALLKTNVALLRHATGLMNESLEANEIPKWLASLLLVVDAILAYAKDLMRMTMRTMKRLKIRSRKVLAF